jgi:ribosome-binding protein aMBF1 (putative translation factor)
VFARLQKAGTKGSKKRVGSCTKTFKRGAIMKKNIPRKSLDQMISKYNKDRDFKIAYDERRFYLQVAHLIRDLREKAGFSQSEVAKKAKVSQPLIARLESGDHRRTPTIDTIHRILGTLGYQLILEVKPLVAA